MTISYFHAQMISDLRLALLTIVWRVLSHFKINLN